jgi:hypothetical protein
MARGIRTQPRRGLRMRRLVAMSDEQIEEAIAAIQAMLAARAGETAKVIEGEAEVVPSLPAPARPTKAS